MTGVLAFVESNTTGSGTLAFQRAVELGLRPLFLTRDRSRYRGIPDGLAIVECETNDVGAVERTLRSNVAPAALAGVTTTSEFYVEVTAAAAERLGLVSLGALAAANCRDKGRTRRILTRVGLAQPRFEIVSNEADGERAAHVVGTPCIIKPTRDTGSFGVLLCSTAAAAAAQVEAVCSASVNVRGQAVAPAALVEEYVRAPEFSVESIRWRSATVWAGITEKRLGSEPHFVEHGHVFPAALESLDAACILDVVDRALDAVGLANGVVHTECRFAEGTCWVIEINARPAGGMIPAVVEAATGIDLIGSSLLIAAGANPAIESPRHGVAGIAFIVAKNQGTLARVDGVDAVAAVDGVMEVVVDAEAGVEVRPPASSYDRLGYVIVRGADRETMVATLAEAERRIEVVTT